jgi:quercetin dioxygenase-like cupin family protein
MTEVVALNTKPRPGGHASADIIGPAGHERHDDDVVGVSLLAPGVIYSDHNHPPEEIYVVMTEGEWFNEQAGWYTPGVGRVVYHRPDIVHAMRSANEPLLAI